MSCIEMQKNTSELEYVCTMNTNRFAYLLHWVLSQEYVWGHPDSRTTNLWEETARVKERVQQKQI